MLSHNHLHIIYNHLYFISDQYWYLLGLLNIEPDYIIRDRPVSHG